MYCREAPSVVTCSASNRAWTPKTLPVRRWQARQWQIETRTGSPSTVSRSCSQLDAASRVLMSGIVDRVGSGDIPARWPIRLFSRAFESGVRDGLVDGFDRAPRRVFAD